MGTDVTALEDYVLTDAVEMDVDRDLAARFDEPADTEKPIGNESQDAPWGLKADGKPRAKPGRKPSGSSTTARRTGGTRSRTRKNEVNYRPAVAGLLQMVAFPLTMAGTAKPEFALDGAAIVIHSPAIADALHEIAVNNPEVARVLEQLMAVGPYCALIGAVIPLVVQIFSNHQILPPKVAENFGALPPEKLMQTMMAMAGTAA